ncbi:binding-protein-dependent transport systems inner membrane component [Thermotoga petrophila RKU-10]|jgi:multiple sugar transport system permease protein|uniref:Binding-protein-dependent transport systems inner membrane component n=1 Tax=Thermotoga petrophila (strain ATCC BAA-489 / DSM 13996 / JCM 10882 / RKU-10) TaxID=590168 RepID=D2C695_THEP2|nr:sugar ABC transporter permease [Thermotoga petrophila]ADA66481.1 binding-protein-dependent transport systems inner membrane component [Thermotoga petrophila RKU-10]
MKPSKKLREAVLAYLFLLPSLVILGMFVFWPVGFSFVLSFFKWDFRNMKNPYFTGLDNYIEIFKFDYPPKYSFVFTVLNTFFHLAVAGAIVMLIVHLIRKRTLSGIISNAVIVLVYIVLNLFNVENPILSFLIAAISWSWLVYDFKRVEFKNTWFWFILFLAVFVFVELNSSLPGLVNFLLDAKDKNLFLKALTNTLYYVILSVPSQIFLSLMIALLLNSNVKFRVFFRTAYFIPFVTSVVAISLVWKWIFNDEFGLLNYILSLFNIEPISWLKDERWTIPTIAIVSVWKTVGYDAVIFLAGLQNIDRSYYEAAEVDGASSLQKFFYITWPLLSPTTFFLLIVSLIGAFKVFAEVYVLYDGLPGPYNNSGMTLVYYVFDLFYRQQRMGIASAAAYILFAIILIFTFIQYRVGRRAVEYVS